MKLSWRIRHKPARMTLGRRGRMKIPMDTRTNVQEPSHINQKSPARPHSRSEEAGGKDKLQFGICSSTGVPAGGFACLSADWGLGSF
ncbi:MAG: hypothetical protein IIB44_06010 [Candidatus Marinimicrobia bacterium]|nr:hypothetical protein [Candidatus Neomarinimicrobiota bacterium]